jgi:hypothetical protein
MLTAEELRQIHRLQLQAGRRVDSLFSGDYRSAFRGRGMEFEEVRAYVPGDDIRHIDWNVTARTGAPFVKEFREERQLTICIALDVSGSRIWPPRATIGSDWCLSPTRSELTFLPAAVAGTRGRLFGPSSSTRWRAGRLI